MSSNNGRGNGQGNGNGRGPPPWAGPPDHVTDDGDGSVNVGPERENRIRETALNSNDQMDRIEAKLDLLLDELGIDE